MTVSAGYGEINTRRGDSRQHWCWDSMIVRATPAFFCAGSRVGARDERGSGAKGAMVLGVEQNYTWQSSLRARARFWRSQNRQQRERTAGAA